MIRFESIYNIGTQCFVPPQWAYQAYAALLAVCPEALANELHEGNGIGVHQYLLPYGPGRCRWVFNIGGREEEAERAITALERIELKPQGQVLERVSLTKKSITATDLLAQSSSAGGTTRIRFMTPTTFRTDGRYAIFPELPLLIQSVARRWRMFLPDIDTGDEDAKVLLINSLWISDYQLATRRFPIKEGIVHGFTGWIEVRGRLSKPMAQLWSRMCLALPYIGVGAKSRLGMGATECETRGRAAEPQSRDSVYYTDTAAQL